MLKILRDNYFAQLVYETNRSRRASPMSQMLSYKRLQVAAPLMGAKLADRLRRSVPNKHELQMLEVE